MSYEFILTEKRNGVFILTLNRPEKRNALNTQMWAEIAQALEAFEADEDARALVITNNGPCFCAEVGPEGDKQRHLPPARRLRGPGLRDDNRALHRETRNRRRRGHVHGRRRRNSARLRHRRHLERLRDRLSRGEARFGRRRWRRIAAPGPSHPREVRDGNAADRREHRCADRRELGLGEPHRRARAHARSRAADSRGHRRRTAR